MVASHAYSHESRGATGSYAVSGSAAERLSTRGVSALLPGFCGNRPVTKSMKARIFAMG